MSSDGQDNHCPQCGHLMITEERPYCVEYRGQTVRTDVKADWCTYCPEAIFEGPALVQIAEVENDLKVRVHAQLGQ